MSTTAREPEDPRVRLAAERTLLAWIRTGVALMGFGFVVARFGLFLRELAFAGRGQHAPSTSPSLWIGVGLVLVGIGLQVVAALQHAALLRRLERGEPYRPPPWSAGIIVAHILALLGIAMVAYLLIV